MGEPLEAVEGSDSEISRLFPKCRPRSATHTPTDARRSDLNLNCVLDSDDNDNYDPQHNTGDLPRIYDNSKLSRDSGSSGRMSVDSGSGSRSGSTPGSSSESHSGSHSESKMERSGEDVDMDMDVSVVSAYDDYDDRYMRSSVLDSSYEEAPPPPPTSRHQPQRREHFRLRDSRIEIAGGREVFSHSRSRPARRRHDESQRRRGQQPQNQQYQQERQQQQQWPESPGDSEERSHGCSVRESPLVYETRLAGSSEVVFDDIGEWVARGLTVRALDDRPVSPSSPTAQQHALDPAEHGDHGYLAAYERSTSPSDSDSTQESTTHKVTKIGNVPIAEYEGSPRRYGPRPSPRTHSPRGGHHIPPPRPPRPGFPRRVLAEEEAAREASCELLAVAPCEASVLPQEGDGEVAPHEDPCSDVPGPDSCSEAESVSPAPPVIAISTLTSSYSGSLAAQPDPNAVDTMYDYSYEMSETRKVLEEFFKEQGGRRDEFPDLEYHLKRQQGNSYVGLRLAAEHNEDQLATEGGEQQQQQQQPSSDLHNSAPEHLDNGLEPHSNGSEHHNSTDIHNNSEEEHYSNGTEHLNIGGVEPRSKGAEQQNGGPDQQLRLLDQRSSSPVADSGSVEHDPEDGTPPHEVSSASPHLNHHLDLSYEAQQDTAQDQQQAPDSISNSSNNSIHSSNSTHSEAGGQETLPEHFSETPQDPFLENSALYDRLNEVVAAALGRECHPDDDGNPGPGSCPEDLSGHEDPELLDLSTEGDHDTASINPHTEDLAETEVGLQVGHSRNFTLSPETTSCDSGDVESDYSGMDPEGSIHSSSRGICSAMPVLEDGLSSGDESGMEVPEEEESKESLFEHEQEQLQEELLQQQQLQQRPVVRSLDEQLCRGELPPLNPLPTLNSHNSPLPNAASSPHTKIHTRNSPHTNAQSPSSSTLKLMKKQITEIEREIAMRRPEGGPRRGGHEGEGPQPPLDLHLLDPLNEKMPEPPPPPAPHPHRGGSGGNSSVVENGSASSTPNQMPAVSPSHVLGHLHSPQYTPVSGPSTGPHLLSAMGSLTSPVQHKVTPHMVPGHPAAHDIHHNPGGGVSQSRESVEAAIADIKQAIRRTKNLPVKSHPQERSPISDKAPVWIPRNSSSRREPHQLQLQQANSGQESQQQSPQQEQQQLEAGAAEVSRTPDHVLRHEDGEWWRTGLQNPTDDGDTDQETDRLLGQQRSDDPGFYDEKEKEANKKKGRSKEVLIEGVLFRARYLGSTQLVSEGQPTKTTRMMQAEEAVSRIKDADDDKEVLVECNDPEPSLGPQHSPSPKHSPLLHHSPASLHTLQESDSPNGFSSPRSQNSPRNLNSPKGPMSSGSLASPVAHEGVVVSPRVVHSPRRGHGYSRTPPENQPSLGTSWKPLHRISQGVPTCPYMTDVNMMHPSVPVVAPLPTGVLEEPIVPSDMVTLIEPREEPVNVIGDDDEYEEEEEEEDDEDEEEEREEQQNVIRAEVEEEDNDDEDDDEERGKNVSLDSEDQCIEVLTVMPGASGTTQENREEELEIDGGGGSLDWVSEEGGGPGLGPAGTVFHLRLVGSVDVAEESGKAPGRKTTTCKRPKKEMVMEAVSHLKALAPDGESQPSTEVDLFISTEKIMVLNTDLKEIMMDHALRTISYIADIGDLVVLMARRRVLPTDDTGNNIQKTPKMICHVFESDEAQFIAQSIGQAFQVAYLEFLKANGIEDHSFVKEMDYQEVLNSQEIFGDELQMFAKKELQKEVVVPKMKSEILGVVVVESGWGSMVPTVVIANLSPTGAAAKCGQLNIGDQIIAINGVSLVGLPLSTCQNYIKNTKYNTAVKLTVVPCPPVVEVKIRRPDTKYQLGFSVQNGVICSLLRGGIAERGGVRVGHRIIDINSQSVVAVPHEKIVNLLATSVGEIRMKTMPTSIFRLLTGQETPQYI